MTRPRFGARVGDQGQRYQIETEGYPKDGWQTFGWATTSDGAERMARGLWAAPGCTNVRVIDRGQPHD